jgi:hypothetical protein
MFLLTLTIASLVIAASMSVVAWRIAVAERRRSEARVEGLAAEIHAGHAPNFQAITYRQGEDLDLRSAGGGSKAATERELFGPVHSAPAASRFATGLTVGVLVLGGGLAATVAFPAIGRRAPAQDPGIAVSASALELVELGQERNGDSFTVRGVVRNPRSGARIDELTAVVFLFAGDGGFITSGRAIIKSVSLGPGGESPFAVTIGGAEHVGRFRVSFRTDDRGVAHVDRRADGGNNPVE